MLYDLNIPCNGISAGSNTADLQRTITFLSELKYTVIALNHHINEKIPSTIVDPIPRTIPFLVPPGVTILHRCTLSISDPSSNHRLPALSQAYDILALRPTTEKAFLSACNTLENFSIISLDLTVRYPFHFRPKPFMTAVKRGIRFEICYAQAVHDGGAEKRRNFISNAMAMVRATKGRGLIVSSEARNALSVRAPADVGNLLSVWGVENDRAKEAMTVAPRSVVVNENMRRKSYRGVIEVVEGGEQRNNTASTAKNGSSKDSNGSKKTLTNNLKGEKRQLGASDDGESGSSTPVSKREAKRLKKAAMQGRHSDSTPLSSVPGTPAP